MTPPKVTVEQETPTLSRIDEIVAEFETNYRSGQPIDKAVKCRDWLRTTLATLLSDIEREIIAQKKRPYANTEQTIHNDALDSASEVVRSFKNK